MESFQEIPPEPAGFEDLRKIRDKDLKYQAVLGELKEAGLTAIFTPDRRNPDANTLNGYMQFEGGEKVIFNRSDTGWSFVLGDQLPRAQLEKLLEGSSVTLEGSGEMVRGGTITVEDDLGRVASTLRSALGAETPTESTVYETADRVYAPPVPKENPDQTTNPGL